MSPMGHRDGVIGAGRQGTAAAFDLAVRGGAEFTVETVMGKP